MLRSEVLPRELGTMVADNPERVIIRNALPIAQALQGLVVFWRCAALLTSYRLQDMKLVSMIERSTAETCLTHEVGCWTELEASSLASSWRRVVA